MLTRGGVSLRVGIWGTVAEDEIRNLSGGETVGEGEIPHLRDVGGE